MYGGCSDSIVRVKRLELTFLHNSIEIWESLQLWYCQRLGMVGIGLDQFLMKPLVYVWVADDVKARYSQCPFSCLYASSNNAGSLLSETL